MRRGNYCARLSADCFDRLACRLVRPAGGGAPGGQAGGGRGGGQGAGAVRTIADRTSGMNKIDGFFPMYWEESTGSLFLEIPELGKEVLWSKGLSAGLGSNDILLALTAPSSPARPSSVSRRSGRAS